ncbi:AfsR/SARP family transcriptional regulator [Tenggerimyces flavus]|uniref:BTAD domain-containing putative transcriptional regulator n=1 Tax=Tenggerimyces flavus TaxID=1708749 RepID=A0ABV7YKL7_9ACTN|nr:AfsR/SARP family transcriptional regulator [Tenggerimyces flavus]MBM7789829.1 DNA-binding SARP family transcriptional activator [Tenggerimyces flavus]
MSGKPSFSVLGPLKVTRGGRPVRVGPPRLRTLLASLLLRANHPVPTSELVERLWNERPPSQPRDAVQLYVVRLRQALGDPRLIRTTPGGYQLELDPTQLDLLRFDQLLRQSAKASETGRRVELLTEALRLWRGPICVDLDSDVLHALDATPVNERRLEAEEQLIDDELSLGHHASQLPRLRRLLAEHPLRERFCGQLMLALYRSGRQAEAVQAYTATADVLTHELGVSPGRELRDLHRAILAADPRLLAADTPAVTIAEPVRPAQLPADTPAFTGRVREVEELLHLAGQPATTVLASRIDGMAGVGKTALAVHVAHRLAPEFPDGQLFVDLYGYTEGRSPLAPGVVLARLLRALGVQDESIPVELDERAALYRSTLAGRRMIVVLDNAHDESQVRPLLPGSPGCLLLITSRRRLRTIDADHQLTLDVLPKADAIAMFTRSHGRERDDSRQAVDELVELCGRLPLALRHAAELFRSRPFWSASQLTERLREGISEVDAAFALSSRDLTRDQERALRLFGKHTCGELTPQSTAILLHSTVAESRRLLEELADAQLVKEHAPDRYRLHVLARATSLKQMSADGAAA